MITLRILKLLEQEGHGTVYITGTAPTDGLYFEKMPQGKTGVAIYSRGAEMGHGMRYRQAFDLYSRGKNDVEGYQILEAIQSTLEDQYTACNLPVMAGIDTVDYQNVSITLVSNIENVGQDENDRVLYSITAQVSYSKPV